jgi:hypothetical protein
MIPVMIIMEEGRRNKLHCNNLKYAGMKHALPDGIMSPSAACALFLL